MAVFKKDKKQQQANEKGQKTTQTAAKNSGNKGGGSELPEEVRKSYLEDVIVSPRITEKATEEAENNVYVFEVARYANKPMVAKAMRYIYNVTPRKINVVNQQPREVTRLGRKGKKSGLKKAYVYLKEGDSIEIV